MEDLLALVPELNLRKRTEKRTTHAKDVQDCPSMKEGEVVTYEWYSDDSGKQWFIADIQYYIALRRNIQLTQAIDELDVLDEVEMLTT